jgi:hypothetical protein
VLVGLHYKGAGGHFILFQFIYRFNTHQVLAGLPKGDGGLVLLFNLFVFISF